MLTRVPQAVPGQPQRPAPGLGSAHRLLPGLAGLGALAAGGQHAAHAALSHRSRLPLRPPPARGQGRL